MGHLQVCGHIYLGSLQIRLGRQQVLLGLRQSLGSLGLFLIQFYAACLQLFLTCLQLLPAILYLFFALLQFPLAFLQLLQAVLQLFPAILQLQSCLLHLLVDGGKNLLVDLIHLLLADNHIDAFLQKTCGLHAGHALNALQFRHHGVFHICTDLCGIHTFHAHRCNHHREHVRVHFHNDGIADRIIPVTLDLIQALPDLQGHRVHVCGLSKLQDHHGIVLVGNGTDALNIAHRGHGRLHRLRHRRLHGLGAGPHVCGHNKHIRQTDAWQKIRCHPGKRHYAQGNHKHHPHQNRIGFLDTEFRDHVRSFLSFDQ